MWINIPFNNVVKYWKPKWLRAVLSKQPEISVEIMYQSQLLLEICKESLYDDMLIDNIGYPYIRPVRSTQYITAGEIVHQNPRI